MRRNDIRNALAQLKDALEKSGITKAVGLVESEQGKSPSMLDALKNYLVLESRFSETTKKLAEILELQVLTHSSIWRHLFGDEAGVKGHLAAYIKVAVETLPLFVALLDQKDEKDYTEVQASGKRTEYEKLSVIVLEDENEFSKPERLIQVLSGVVALYQNCARIDDLPESELVVLSCDSGSDKSFDFLGLAKVMEQVKEIFIALWDRVVFFKEKRLSSNFDVIAQGLPILAKLTELESTNKIGREEAEIIRRGILVGCSDILGGGAIIPEIHAHSVHNPRVLMAPETKLLMAPPSQGSKNGEEGTTNARCEDTDDDDRIKEIEKMLKDLKGKKKSPKGNTSSKKDSAN